MEWDAREQSNDVNDSTASTGSPHDMMKVLVKNLHYERDLEQLYIDF